MLQIIEQIDKLDDKKSFLYVEGLQIRVCVTGTLSSARIKQIFDSHNNYVTHRDLIESFFDCADLLPAEVKIIIEHE